MKLFLYYRRDQTFEKLCRGLIFPWVVCLSGRKKKQGFHCEFCIYCVLCIMSSAGPPKGRAAKDKPQMPQSQNIKSTTEGSKAADGLNPKIQPTAEQIRIAQIINDANKNEDLQHKVEQVMEITNRSKDDAIIALHDSDNDPDKAITLLLEGVQSEGKWETTGKKKKNRQVSAHKPVEHPVANNTSPTNNKENRNKGEKSRDREPKERDGFRNRGPPRLSRMGGGRNWRNKENEKNERNLEDGTSEHNRRLRTGRRGRGRGGGNRSRTFQNQKMGGGLIDTFPQSIDTWTNITAEQAETGGGGDATMSVGNWSDIAAVEDWSEEDWTESLTETKVFTPSSSSHLLVGPVDDATSTLTHSLDLSTLQKDNTGTGSLGSPTVLSSGGHSQHIHPSMMTSQINQSTTQSAPNQFSLSQYAQQATESIKAAVGVVSRNSNSFSSITSGSSPNYSTCFESPSSSAQTGPLQAAVNQSVQSKPVTHTQPQPISSRVKPQRMRGPQSSKIPETAVEMPDNAIMSLDVQFGALEFGTDSSPFDFTATSEAPSSFNGSGVRYNVCYKLYWNV
ncbi:ubiquitin-associated protein 2-like isoform X1 [Limulus polyphemus]|uniref:Ubiquitin-associated protein 2-like isoform X1 n=2 Tax=Limulus polyphemus TaxID=6850 RepID=A0ABM1TQC6_LIMPO|nr:ubiquitin-associated protein 2-like isoform X1 [Limulus polyphemus]